MKDQEITKFTFRYDNVLVKSFKQKGKTTEDGLIVPEQRDDKPEYGEVIAVGPGRVLDNGTVLETKLKVGDIVFFGMYSSQETRSNGQDYYILREEDIIAVK